MARATFERFFFFFLEGRDGPDSEAAVAGTSSSDPEADSSPALGSAVIVASISGDALSSSAFDLEEVILSVSVSVRGK